mmetsp:Transcript_16937/g.38857  ORF Transcript_16937/g.38857 Transcript_16937/m.38857 type:complete len:266 (-) Transcript_16937:130-927(-)
MRIQGATTGNPQSPDRPERCSARSNRPAPLPGLFLFRTRLPGGTPRTPPVSATAPCTKTPCLWHRSSARPVSSRPTRSSFPRALHRVPSVSSPGASLAGNKRRPGFCAGSKCGAASSQTRSPPPPRSTPPPPSPKGPPAAPPPMPRDPRGRTECGGNKSPRHPAGRPCPDWPPAARRSPPRKPGVRRPRAGATSRNRCQWRWILAPFRGVSSPLQAGDCWPPRSGEPCRRWRDRSLRPRTDGFRTGPAEQTSRRISPDCRAGLRL